MCTAAQSFSPLAACAYVIPFFYFSPWPRHMHAACYFTFFLALSCMQPATPDQGAVCFPRFFNLDRIKRNLTIYEYQIKSVYKYFLINEC